jgi:GNAT superfamily N-acetyltransferase
LAIRLARHEDVAAIQLLIARSVRALSVGYYTREQIEAALTHVFGVDTQLIVDGTYYVIEIDERLAAAGGWSKRRTLYGGDQTKGEEDPLLDPSVDAGRIRAFFVDPDFARRGLARRLYNECARHALSAGFNQLELMSTAPGEPLYAALGFEVIERVIETLPGGIPFPLIRMIVTINERGLTN